MATPSQAAVSTQYGAPIGEYRGGIGGRIGTGIIGAIMLIMGLLAVAAPLYLQDSPRLMVLGIFVGVGFIAGALYFFWTIWRMRGAHAQLFEQGFIISLGGKTISARWDDIVSVTQQITRVDSNGIPAATVYSYSLLLANGKKVHFNNTFKNVPTLGETIQRMSANVLLPRAIASYQSGASIPFGKISISQAGVSNGKETVPWSNIKHLAVQNGALNIRRTDKRLAWVNTPTAKTPNLYVLLELAGRIQRGTL